MTRLPRSLAGKCQGKEMNLCSSLPQESLNCVLHLAVPTELTGLTVLQTTPSWSSFRIRLNRFMYELYFNSYLLLIVTVQNATRDTIYQLAHYPTQQVSYFIAIHRLLSNIRGLIRVLRWNKYNLLSKLLFQYFILHDLVLRKWLFEYLFIRDSNYL